MNPANKKYLLWAFTFVWLLGPIEPVFADGGIADQFPDMVSRQPGGRVWAEEVKGQNEQLRAPWVPDAAAQAPRNNGPWDVEIWTGGRRRYKHFNGRSAYNNFNADNNYHPSRNYASFNSANSYSNGPADNGASYDPRNTFNVASGERKYVASTALPGSSNQADGVSPRHASPWLKAVPPIGGYDNSQLSGPGGDIMPSGRKPDKFADTPQVDDSGIRRFGNGRHYDLKKIPMEDALNVSAASDDQIREEQAMARARARQRDRMRRFNQF